MQVWGELFAAIGAQALQIEAPSGVEWAWIDPSDGLRSLAGCQGAVQLPFIQGSAPTDLAPCAQGVGGAVRRSLDWFKGISE